MPNAREANGVSQSAITESESIQDIRRRSLEFSSGSTGANTPGRESAWRCARELSSGTAADFGWSPNWGKVISGLPCPHSKTRSGNAQGGNADLLAIGIVATASTHFCDRMLAICARIGFALDSSFEASPFRFSFRSTTAYSSRVSSR
jgi:hypothetical protein